MSNPDISIKMLHEASFSITALAQIWLNELGGIWMPDTKKLVDGRVALIILLSAISTIAMLYFASSSSCMR